MNLDRRAWRQNDLQNDKGLSLDRKIFSRKSLNATALAFIASLSIYGVVRADDAAKPEPVQLGTFTNQIDTWTLDTPSTVFGFEKFGLRRGAYNLHVTVDGKAADIPLDPRVIAKAEDKKSMFAKWEVENELVKLAQLNGSSPIMLTYKAEGDGIVKVQKIELASGAKTPAPAATPAESPKDGTSEKGAPKDSATADAPAAATDPAAPPATDPTDGGNQNGLQYLLSGKTPVDSKDQIYFDMETVTILTIFLVIIVPAYGLMLFSKNNMQTLGSK